MIVLGRRALPWLVGPAVLLFRGSSVELAPPSRCPGLLELMSIAAVRTWPDLTVGVLFTLLHTLFIVAGLAVFVELLCRFTRNVGVAVATGLAIGLSPLFAHTLAPPWEAAAFAACASVALLWCQRRDRSNTFTGLFAARTTALLLAAALAVPAWACMAATGAGIAVASVRRRFTVASRWLTGSAVTAVFMLLVLVVLDLSRPDTLAGSTSWLALATCARPQPSMRLVETMSAIRWLVGPFGLALALLGTFASANRFGVWASLSAASVAMIGLALLAGAARDAPAVLAPWIVALWWLAASGMQEVVVAAGRRSRGWVAGAVLLVLLPTLQGARVAGEERDDWVRPLGHERATLRQITAMLNIVDSDGKFVEEDSSVDMLLRASVVARRRTIRRVIVVPRHADAIRRAMATGPVYAFPRGQDDLSYRGFVIEPITAIGFRRDGVQERMAGIAGITGMRPCAVIGNTWVALSDASSSGRFALAADSEPAHGPIAIYLGEKEPSQPQPDGWPPRTARGFRFSVFDQRTKGRSERLLADAREMGLTNHAVLSAPAVVSLLLHRTPRAPRALAVRLGAPFSVGVAKLAEGAVNAGVLTICDAPPIQIQAFGARVE